MPFSAALSLASRTAQALDEVVEPVARQLDGASPDFACFFVSHHHAASFEGLGCTLGERLGARVLIGCTGESIVGLDREVEGRPALAVWAAAVPEATVTPFHLTCQQTPEGLAIAGWPDTLPSPLPAGSLVLLFGDGFTFPVDPFFQRLQDEHSEVPVVGGMASGGTEVGQNKLFSGERVLEEGAVGAVLSGPLEFRTVVSQGCRPIGHPLVVTRSERNVVVELGGRPALERLQEIFEQLDACDQALVRHGRLHVGTVINEYQEHFRRGDFLVRNLMGADSQSGAIALNDFVRTGQTVQFHVRDHRTADEDLQLLLRGLREDATFRPAASLLFTCNGRGTRLFSEPNHDAEMVRHLLGAIPLAGFFAQGELGPIGGRNFIHGFTASLVVFGDRCAQS